MICSSYFLDKQNHTHVTNLPFPQVNELLTAEQVSSTSQSKNLETSYRFNRKSLVEEWSELDDFPSSEDLSMFLADLDAIAIRKFDPSLRTPCTKDSLLMKFSRFPSRIDCQASSQILYYPLIQGTRLYNEICFQGSPILFSPMSNTSC